MHGNQVIFAVCIPCIVRVSIPGMPCMSASFLLSGAPAIAGKINSERELQIVSPKWPHKNIPQISPVDA